MATEEAQQGKSVVDQVMDGIIRQIISGELVPGGKLPTEMELCRQFGAGRNSVREAVKKLQAYGILYIKRADGTFVSETYNRKMLDPMLYSLILQHNSWKDFVELRAVIDIGTLNIIVQRTDINSFLPELYRTYGELSAELHSPEPSLERVLELDMKFHSRIAGAANNPMLETITEYITLLTLPSRRETTRKVMESGEIDNFVELHRRLLTVIERHQTEEIVQAVQDHYVYWK
ncbi:MAG: GntR family transcriptional regulator [Candidatus Faecousia sp.]|nr:GntR family transcriptional regulator [Candidatus Faecousia sp.]